MRCRIELLGEIRVVVGGRLVPRFQTMRTAALLGYLALHPGRPHPREHLAELIWPEGDPSAIRNRLNQAVSSMRRQLEPPGVVPESILRSDRLTIRLMDESIETDVDEFRRLTNTVLTTDRATEAIVSGQAALTLYRGDLMDGLYDDWIMPDRLALEDAYTQTVVRVARAYSSVGNYDDSVACASRLSVKDPSDESVHQLIMQTYLKAGRPAAARRQYQELVRILATDNATPSELSQKFYERAKAARLKEDEDESTGPFTVIDAPSVEPVAASPSFPIPPRPLTGFFGRNPELSALAERLGDPRHRIVTITGLGGTGKTRLAMRALEGRTDIAWVGMAESEPGAAVADEIVRQWFVFVTPGQSIELAISHRLAQSGPMTLLLDNLDEPSDKDRQFLSDLLQRNPDLRLVITARHAIELDGEMVISLGPLEVPTSDMVGDLVGLAKNPSVALFLHRSQFVRPDLQLSERNAGVITELCQRLDGIPLAIELAASWARSLSPRQMLDRLDERFALLESRRKDIPDRHRTMKTVLESTWRMLDSETQLLFPMLSVFEGRMSMDAMRFIAPEVNVDHAVSCLVEHSLLQVDASPDEETRYSMLDTVRQFCSEFLSAEGEGVLRYRHVQIFLNKVESTYEKFNLDQPGEHLLAVDRDRPDLYASLAYCEKHYRPDGLKMVRYMAPYWEHRSLLSDGRDWISRMIAGEEVRSQLIPVLIDLARLEWLDAAYAQSDARLSHLLKTMTGPLAGVVLAQAYLGLALERHRQGDFDEEANLLEHASQTLPAEGAKIEQIRLLLAKGHLAVERHELEEAERHYEAALKLARGLRNSIRIGACLLSLGNLAMVREQYDAARVLLFEAMDQLEQGQSLTLSTVFLPTIARLERRTNHIARAYHWLDRLMALAPERTDLMIECLREHVVLAINDHRDDDAAKLAGLIESAVAESGTMENREQDDYRRAVEVGFARDSGRWQEQAMVGRAMGLDHALRLVRSWQAEPVRDFVGS